MAKPFTQKDRDNVYNQFINKLMSINLFDSELESIKKLKVIMKLYKDSGMEFKGELLLPHNGKIIYELYNDHRKQTKIDISKNINRPLAPFERKEYSNQIMDLLKNKKVWDSEDKNIKKIKNAITEYKDNGSEFIGTLNLPTGEKIILELFNNHLKENTIKVIGDRKNTYEKIIDILKKMEVYDSDNENINELKQHLLDYNNTGKEFRGTIEFPNGSKMVLDLFKNTNKNIINVIEGSEPMALEERKEIVEHIISGLKNNSLIDPENDEETIRKIVRICMDYKKESIEAIGELPLSKGPIKIVYELYKDHRKKSIVKITSALNKNEKTKNFYENNENINNGNHTNVINNDINGYEDVPQLEPVQ